MKVVGKYFALVRRLRFYEVLLLIFIAIVLGAWSLKEITESALFCGSTCHIMRPFYEDWKTSAHNTVPCVDCHLKPSDKQQFVPQFKAIQQVAGYLTRSGELRRAEVSDLNCLKEGCHSKRLLNGRVTFGNNIRFDHTPHLQQLRRGKILRCTTCHARVAMGQHVTVTVDPCFICHFKSGGKIPPTSDCLLCHDTGETGDREQNSSFDHRPLVVKGVPCTSCHQGVTRGNGKLKPESCRSCHEKPMTEGLKEPVELLHRVHVTDHKVGCTVCHEPIRHSLADDYSTEPLSCTSCHEDKHKGIQDMLNGTGAKGVPPSPSPMEKVRVGCTGCHIVPDPTGGLGATFRGTDLIAVQAACQSCHPESYSKKVEQWKREIDAALGKAEKQLSITESKLSAESYKDSRIRRLMENTRYNILFVKNSTPVHNPDYAIQVLQKAIQDLSDITEKSGQR